MAAKSSSIVENEQQQPIFDFHFEYNRRELPSLKYHPMVVGDDTTSEEENEELFVAGVADMDFAVAPCIQHSLQRRLQHPILGYEAVPPGLYPAFGEWMERRHGWNPLLQANKNDDNNGDYDVSVILRAPNVLNALAMALCAFTEPGDGVLVQPPVFFDFYDIIKENFRTVVKNPLIYNSETGRYTMNLKHLKELLAASNNKIKVMFLCNPHNPIGRVWTKQELEELADICRLYDVLIVSDEIHADLCFGRAFIPMASIDPDNCIALHSPAKTFNIASCCSAFTIILNKKLRKQMQAENSRLTVSKNNAFASVAMEAAYRQGDTWVDAMLEYVQGNVQLLRTRLLNCPVLSHRIRLVEPGGTFLVWLDCRDLDVVDDSDGYALKIWFRKEAGWAVTRGASFGLEHGHGFVRVNVACPRQRLDRAMERLEKAVTSTAETEE